MQKSILITGCSSGIGHDAAQGLRARGWRVFASCRKAGDCDRLRAQGFDSPRIDYTEPASIGAGLAEVLDATGGTLDALFNNGAHGFPGAVEDIPTAAYPTPAQRPLNSRLDCSALGAEFGIAPPDWRKGLAQVIGKLKENGA